MKPHKTRPIPAVTPAQGPIDGQIWQTRSRYGQKRFIFVHYADQEYARCETVTKVGRRQWRRKHGARLTEIRCKEFERFRFVGTGTYLS